MADRILSVQTLNLTAGGPAQEIIIPGIPNFASPNCVIQPSDSIVYVFDGSNRSNLELMQTSTDTEGIKIGVLTEKTIGSWRIRSEPPKWIYQPTGADTSVRVTVVLLR